MSAHEGSSNIVKALIPRLLLNIFFMLNKIVDIMHFHATHRLVRIHINVPQGLHLVFRAPRAIPS